MSLTQPTPEAQREWQQLFYQDQLTLLVRLRWRLTLKWQFSCFSMGFDVEEEIDRTLQE
ncbi:hypothetical protein [Phormidesmis priestleyi]